MIRALSKSSTLCKAIRLGPLMLVALVLSIALPQVAATADAPAAQAAAAAANAPSPEQLRNASWIADGRLRFVQTCAYCHGTRGEGGKNKPFEERTGWDPHEIFNVISNGRIRGANAMPSWKESFSEREIWQLVAYVKSLSADFAGPIDDKSPK
ncbi:MAG: cytochrome c [Hyphomicrobium sp.]|uniref:c-type cytochrome n=1 Tax=Hyphomicrobium sp. TaxID=82 RepID=UPI003D09BF71